MSAFRPLPPTPSLEFERKEAKALLRRLKAGESDALARARARHRAISQSPKLADAQLVIAREYGFASWPKLVRYFEDAEHQRLKWQSTRQYPGISPDHLNHFVRSLLTAYGARRAHAGRTVAAVVPRFYGMTVGEVFDAALTEDEARLAVARVYGFSNWEEIVAFAGTARRSPRPDEPNPARDAAKAMEALDLSTLQQVVNAHRDLFRPQGDLAARCANLMASAIHWERKHGRDAFRPIMDWLTSLGFDRQLELNVQLCGRMKMNAELVRELIKSGADPNWVAPNGVPVLEHALIRYWNGELVDVLAQHATPRKALWIAAGLGDVEGVARFLDHRGRPTAAARSLRPPFELVGPPFILAHPDPDDEEILIEAFFVAMLNYRTEVLEYMVSRGTPVDSMVYDSPLILMAIGNGWMPVVECLVRCGANLDLRAEHHPRQTAREMARELFKGMPQDADRRRIAELCGMDPQALLAERNSERPSPPPPDPRAARALKLAADDAARMGQSVVTTENLLVGILRAIPFAADFLTLSGGDVPRLWSVLNPRLLSDTEPLEGQALAMDRGAAAAVQGAVTLADERWRDSFSPFHIMAGIVNQEAEPGSRLLHQFGVTKTRILEVLTGDL